MVLVGVLLTPAPAWAEEDPGYGGTAQSLTVDRQGDDDLAMYAVGFRGGSPVTSKPSFSSSRWQSTISSVESSTRSARGLDTS